MSKAADRFNNVRATALRESIDAEKSFWILSSAVSVQ